MMPEEGRDAGANRDATNDANDATIWLPVAKVAQLEKVSVRAVQRRCQSGKYGSRRVQTPQGERLEVDAATLTTQATRRRDDERDARPQERRDASDAPTPETPKSDAPDLAARYVERLESEVDFLRRALEQRDRDAAELRAALREALKAQPRQLEAPAKSPETAQEGATNEAAPQVAPETKAPAKEGAQKKEPRPLWKIVLGVR